MKTYTEIEKLADEVYPTTDMGKLKSNIGFIKGYNQCQEDMADKWISVNDVKPKQNQYVLIYGKGDRQMTSIYQDGDFCCYDMLTECLEIAEEITHWMPLPNKPLNKQDYENIR
jgi:hypothetical protein